MFSFFTRKQHQNQKQREYNTNISKYIFDITNKIKANNETNTNKIPDTFVSLNVNHTNKMVSNLIPVISMLSFLAGYYLANK
jgi:hypothetical protein